MAGGNLNSTIGNFNQLVECPRCGKRFELSETFRDHFEEEKRKEVEEAVRESAAGIRADLEQANQKKLEENAKQVRRLEAQLKADREVYEKREAEIRVQLEQASQEKLEESAEQVKKLEAQLKAGREVHEKREVEIRAEMEQASQAEQEERAEQIKALQEELKSNQMVQEKREAEIRAEMEKTNQATLAKSKQQVKDLETQLQDSQEAQEKREAEIRAEMEQASQAEQKERDEQIKALQEELKSNQIAQEKRETEIRAAAEKAATEKFDVDREEFNIERRRLDTQMVEMRRKLGQKSVELQGEALESYLKGRLQITFPFDTINDIARGQHGADLTHEVIDGQLGSCGIIMWEAKRTKRWNDNWLSKIKDDADRVGAHLCAIVSEALPADVRVFALKEGVWVSSVEGAIALAQALRSQLIESTRLQRAAQGQDLKMDEIYRYLTSARFGARIQRMVETWKALEEQVNSEERSMKRQWSQRRKQLARIENTTIEMFTDFSAILGQEIAQVPGLEPEALPSGDEIRIINP